MRSTWEIGILPNFDLVGHHGQLFAHKVVEAVHFFPEVWGQYRSPCFWDDDDLHLVHVARLVSGDVGTVVGREDGFHLKDDEACEVRPKTGPFPTHLLPGNETLGCRGYKQVFIVGGVGEAAEAVGKNNGDQKRDHHKTEFVSWEKEPSVK